MFRISLAMFMLACVAVPVTAEEAAFDSAKAAETMLAKIDTDKSGGLSLQEWTTAGRRERGFGFMDANKDGNLDKAELGAGLTKANERGMLPK